MAADEQQGTGDTQAQHPSIMDVAWCRLDWAPWVALEREAIRRTAQGLPGVYRIRRAGGRPERLVYVGQTGRTLRERLLSLAAGANADEFPFNDPHTAASHFWLLLRLDGAQLECSCATVEGNVQVLRGTEDMLLWRHRVETGLSAEANYGRFYPGYARPTNRWIVRGGRSGTRRNTRPQNAAVGSTGSAMVDFAALQPVLQGDVGPLQAPLGQRRALFDPGHSMPAAPQATGIPWFD